MRLSRSAPLGWTLLLVQGGHVLEHMVQSAQVYFFGVSRPQAHGLLGAVFDFEWVHLAYNTVFLAALAWLFRAYGPALRERARGWVWSSFVLGLVLQSYHEVEHVVKITQHEILGQTPAPGILGNLVDLVLLHLGFNLVVYGAVVPLLMRSIRAPVLGAVAAGAGRIVPHRT